MRTPARLAALGVAAALALAACQPTPRAVNAPAPTTVPATAATAPAEAAPQPTVDPAVAARAAFDLMTSESESCNCAQVPPPAQAAP